MEQPDDTSFREIAQTIWAGKWLIVCVTVLVAATTAGLAWLLPRQYRASVVLSPVGNSSSGGALGSLGGLASQLSGIASLAGVTVGTDSVKAETLATLQSDVLTRQFIQEENLLPLMLRNVRAPPQIPGADANLNHLAALELAAKKFKDISDLEENSRTGLVTFSVRWTDPVLAANWANTIVKMTNDYVREKAIRRSENNIAYLTQQSTKTDIAGVRSAIFTILESELKNAMLARGTEEYALTVIDPAVPPVTPWSPRRTVWVMVGTLGGLFASLLIVLVRRAWLRQDRYIERRSLQ